MMKRLTLLLWVAGLFILGLSSLHAQTGGPFLPSAADNRCRQWVDNPFFGKNDNFVKNLSGIICACSQASW